MKCEDCGQPATKQVGLPWEPAMFFVCDKHAAGPWPHAEMRVADIPEGFNEEVPDCPPES